MRLPFAAVLLLAMAHPSPAPAADLAAIDAVAGDRVTILTAADPAYRGLTVPDRARIAPEAPTRLLVFLGGSCVLDRGLREERPAPQSDGSAVEQRGIAERAMLSVDGQVALVETIRYVNRAETGQGTIIANSATLRGSTDLTWIDPYHPGGKWVFTLDAGRWLKKAVPLARRRGVAVATYREIAGEADFRLLGPDGKESVAIPEGEAWALDIQASPDGRYVAVDQGYAAHPGRPDRGVLVVDVAAGSRWTYTWTYGGDDEPTSWNLEDGGVLVVARPGGKTLRFAPGGAPLR